MEQGQQSAPEAQVGLRVPDEAPPIKTFTRSTVKRVIPLSMHLPKIYPGVIFKFELRIKLSKDAEETRQEFMSLAPAEQTIKEDEQQLTELCDLLVSYPEGFGDLTQQGSPGAVFMDYVKTADAEAQATLHQIVKGAMVLYWRTISPQEFRPSV